ncbi:MAG: PAS domain S-box protein [Sphingobacteriaceae bacterium]|nr:MAG: PAS domain S-box protein [Sphingobacteriaceae bacterium]
MQNLKNDLQPDNLNQDLEKYKTLIKASNIGAWEYYSSKEFFWCNDTYFSMLGRNIADYSVSGNKNLNTAWVDLIHPEDKINATKKFADYLKNPVGLYENYFRMSHANGQWVWIWSRGSILEGAQDGSSPIIIGTHIDITEHKEAEEAIAQERILLRTLIDSLPDIIFVKDAEGKKIIANRADVSSMRAKTEAEVIGKTDIELYPNEIGLRGYEDDMSVLKQGVSILNKEEFFLDDSGNKRWMLTSKIPVIDENGKIIRLLGIGHNITARKESEETLNKLNQDLLAQSEELKALNAQLTKQKEQELEKAIAQGKFEIASEVLHDIGNALVGFGSYLNRINRAIELNNLDTVKNLAAFLKAQHAALATAIGTDKANALVTLTENLANTQSTNQQEIATSMTELLNIISHIQEILNIQRQFVRDHGSGSHERKPVNIANLIDNCRSMLFASMDRKGIQLKINVQPGLPIIKGDHTKLMQVILNVLKNSVEAIHVDTPEKQITVAAAAADEGIVLVVTDNGQGFTAETGSRFFERGFTTKKTGTGLGLYNCKSIIESHGGTFSIKSDGPGLGAVTTIKLEVDPAN